MYKTLLLFLCLFVASASSTFAQSNNSQHQTAIKLTSGSDISDPWGLLETEDEYDNRSNKASGVKSVLFVNMSSAERTAFSMINQTRVQYGLTPLAWNDEIAAVARVHSQSMAEFKFFSHRGLDNSMVSDRADKLGLGRWRSIGENIAFNRGFQDPVAMAVQLWLDSPAHRRSLLDNNWKESAIGVAQAADGAYYFTQVFLVRR